jgi:hypothetical protein
MTTTKAPMASFNDEASVEEMLTDAFQQVVSPIDLHMVEPQRARAAAGFSVTISKRMENHEQSPVEW